MKRLFAMFSLIVLRGVVSLHAGIIAYNDPANQASVGDGAGNIALIFNVNSPISVTDLGVFNAFGSGTITGTVQVVIWNIITNAQATPVATFHGSYTPAGLGYDVFQSITPVTLGVGSYEVDEVGLGCVFGCLDDFGNQAHGSTGPVLNTGGGLLTFNGAAYDESTTLDEPFPGSCSGCNGLPSQSSQFDAGTFEFQSAVTTPEPSYAVMLGSGFLLLSLLRLSRGFRRVRGAVQAQSAPLLR
jgi:hypothetical protein